jgi:intergrase/recombinase
VNPFLEDQTSAYKSMPLSRASSKRNIIDFMKNTLASTKVSEGTIQYIVGKGEKTVLRVRTT